MGIFDNLRKKNNKLKIKEIIAKDYKQKYFHECKEIWKIMCLKRDRQKICRENY